MKYLRHDDICPKCHRGYFTTTPPPLGSCFPDTTLTATVAWMEKCSKAPEHLLVTCQQCGYKQQFLTEDAVDEVQEEADGD